MKKFINVSNYGIFICNIFGWDRVKIGFIRIKFQFGDEWISKTRLVKDFVYMIEGRKLVVGEI